MKEVNPGRQENLLWPHGGNVLPENFRYVQSVMMQEMNEPCALKPVKCSHFYPAIPGPLHAPYREDAEPD